jgi:hypothetical protein
MKRIHVGAWAVVGSSLLAAMGGVTVTADAGVGFRAARHTSDTQYEVALWTDREGDALYGDGERARVWFQPEQSAYVVVYGIDVEGDLHLLYPTHRDDPRFCHADVEYEVDHPMLDATGVDGVVYVQAVACAYPLEPYFPNCFRRHQRPSFQPWSYGSGFAAEFGVVIGDPYLALAEIRGWLVPRGCEPRHLGFATLSYACQSPRFYPRYLCADCHSGSWYDPYDDVCAVFEIRVDSWWNEPVHAYSCQPRYHYWKRACAPPKYRSWKSKWSSKDRRLVDKDATLAAAFAGKTRGDRDYIRTRVEDRPQSIRGRDDAKGRALSHDEKSARPPRSVGQKPTRPSRDVDEAKTRGHDEEVRPAKDEERDKGRAKEVRPAKDEDQDKGRTEEVRPAKERDRGKSRGADRGRGQGASSDSRDRDRSGTKDKGGDRDGKSRRGR